MRSCTLCAGGSASPREAFAPAPPLGHRRHSTSLARRPTTPLQAQSPQSSPSRRRRHGPPLMTSPSPFPPPPPSPPPPLPTPPPSSSAAAAITAAAAVVAASVVASVALPSSAYARITLVPTPINAYAARRQERAYQAYMSQLEERFEAVSAADMRAVVQQGGGGISLSYRVAGVAAFVASAASTAIVHPLDTLKTRVQGKAERVGAARAERDRRKVEQERAREEESAAEEGEKDEEERGREVYNSGGGGDVAVLQQLKVEVGVEVDVSGREGFVDDYDEVAAIEAEKLDTSGLYRGIVSNILKEAPNAAIYLAVYEILKNFLLSTSTFHNLPLLVFIIAGALGDAIGSIVRCPAEIVNKRLQLGVNDSGLEALRDAFLTAEGRQASSVAWGAVLLRDVPYGGLQIALYEFGRQLILTHPDATGLSAGVLTDVITGAAAGCVAAMVTTPADVLVTRLSVQNPQCYLETRRYMGVVSTLQRILRDEGVGALFAGVFQRGAYYAPLIGLFFALYEATRGVVADPSLPLGFLLPK